MKLAVYIDQAAALRNGYNVPRREVFVDVDPATISEEDRALLAACVQPNSMGKHGGVQGSYVEPILFVRVGGSIVTVYAPTLDGIRFAIIYGKQELAEKEQEKAKAEADRKAEIVAQTQAVLDARKTATTRPTIYARRDKSGEIKVGDYYAFGDKARDGWADYRVVSPDWPYNNDEDVRNSGAAMAWRNELCRANAVALQTAQDAAVKNLEEKEAAAVAASQAAIRAIADQNAWIAAHGSTRLQRCAAEGIDCQSIYRDERLAFERPEWQWISNLPDEAEFDDPRNPSDAAINLLDKGRAVDPDCELRYLTIDEQTDDYGDTTCDSIRKCVVVGDFLGREIVLGY